MNHRFVLLASLLLTAAAQASNVSHFIDNAYDAVDRLADSTFSAIHQLDVQIDQLIPQSVRQIGEDVQTVVQRVVVRPAPRSSLERLWQATQDRAEDVLTKLKRQFD